jgi:hypothetical protein
MDLWDTLGLTPQLAIWAGIGALGIALLIGAQLYRRTQRQERVRIDLNSRS